MESNTCPLIKKKAIGSKCVFRLKENLDDTLNKYKAHFVGKGFKQVAGYDFHETFSLTIKQTTIWVVFTLALSNSWHVRQLDVSNALLS